MNIAKDRLPKNAILASEIELRFDPEDDHEIWAPVDHAIALESELRDHGVSSFIRKPLITSTSGILRDIHSIQISGSAAAPATLISVVRDYLTKQNIDWHEPYAETSAIEHFRFFLPFDPIYK